MIYKKLKNNINASALVDIDGSIKEQVDANTLAIRQNTDKINQLNTNVENTNITVGDLTVKVDDAVAKVDGYEQRVSTNETNIATNTQGLIDVNQRIDSLPQPDLSNYYTKQEVDASQEAQNTRIDSNQDLINQNIEDIGLKANQSDLTALENIVNTKANADDLNNYLLKQNTSDTTVVIETQGQAYFNFNKIQPTAGFRNYTGIKLNVKHGSTAPLEEAFKIYVKNSNDGVFMTCENDKLSFDNATTINNIANPTNANEAANKDYVDNAIRGIPSVDLSGYYNKGETNQLLNNKANSSDLQPIIQKNGEQDTAIANNLQRIEANETQINQLIAENEKQIHIVFEIQDTQTYEKGSQGFKGNQWYLSLVDNASGAETDNPAKWKKINYETEVDLSNYYTKLETNNLLNPLEGRLTAIEGKNREQDTAIAANASTLNNKANNNEVVKLTGNQTINGEKNFSSNVGFNNFRIGSESGGMRIFPTQTGKWLYFGNPSSQYFAGIDLNNRVSLINIKNPEGANDAANKQYVDNKFASVPQPDLSPYATNELLEQTRAALQASIDANQELINQNIEDIGTKANDSDVVKLTGDQTIQGEKRFEGICRVVRTPTVDLMIANKKYVDDKFNIVANKTINVNKNELTLTRTDIIGQANNDGMFFKWYCNNESVKQFIWDHQRNNKKNLTFHFILERTKIVVNTFTVVDDSSTTLLFNLPPFVNNNQITNFFNKSAITQVVISSAG